MTKEARHSSLDQAETEYKPSPPSDRMKEMGDGLVPMRILEWA